VVSGPHAAIEACLAAARAQGDDGQILRTSHAFHSSMLEPMLERCAAAFAGVRMSAPTVPVVSCLTGGLADPARIATPAYWVEQMRRPVRFADVVQTALAQPIDVFIDLGPATVAAGLVMANLGDARAAVLSAAPGRADPADGVGAALRALGGLWARGADLPWSAFYADRPGRRVQMPLYPFQRRRCWVDPPALADAPAATVAQVAPVAAVSGVMPEPRLDGAAFDEAAFDETAFDETAFDENQRVVAAVWEELLGVRGIGLHDSFFALGGQSLLATRVMSRLHEITGVELPVETIFAQPTIAGVADALFERRLAQTDPEELERLLAEL
jgi:acyl transferase domain-containing protein